MSTRHKTRVEESLKDKVSRLSAMLEDQQQQLDELRRHLPPPLAEVSLPRSQERVGVGAEGGGHSRRELLRLAGAAVAGAAGTVALQSIPVSAGNGAAMTLGVANDATATTQLHPTTATPSTPLLQVDASTATNSAVALGVIGANNANAISAQAGTGATANAIAGTAGSGGTSNGVAGTAGAGSQSYGVVGFAGSGITSSGVAGSGGPGSASSGVLGTSGAAASSAGVVGNTVNGFGVVGQATTGIDVAASGNGRLAQAFYQIGGSGAPNFLPGNALLEIIREDDGSVWASRAVGGNPPVVATPQGAWKRLNAVRVDAADGTGNPFVAARVLSTINGTGAGAHIGPMLPGQVWDFGPFTNANGIPPDAVGLIGNLTAVASDGAGNPTTSFAIAGWLALTPGGVSPISPVSNVNYGGPVNAVPNFFLVGFGTGSNAGKLRIQNGGGTKVHVLIDVFGYLQ